MREVLIVGFANVLSPNFAPLVGMRNLQSFGREKAPQSGQLAWKFQSWIS